jgi:murein DD-endopeptidase MepM/ murein hydrolase activator NlpD
VLYGHLKTPTTLKIGDRVACGQTVGAVGNTGLSGNAHLHLEMRVGPSGATFSSMGYYDPRASQEEFDNYCTWRVSQLFQLLDPMTLLKLK